MSKIQRAPIGGSSGHGFFKRSFENATWRQNGEVKTFQKVSEFWSKQTGSCK
jgi:hypothetical protein